MVTHHVYFIAPILLFVPPYNVLIFHKLVKCKRHSQFPGDHPAHPLDLHLHQLLVLLLRLQCIPGDDDHDV